MNNNTTDEKMPRKKSQKVKIISPSRIIPYAITILATPADELWKNKCIDLVRGICENNKFFFSDDIKDIAKEFNVDIPRGGLSPVMNTCCNYFSYCMKTGRAKKSKYSNTTTTEWKSLIYMGEEDDE